MIRIQKVSHKNARELYELMVKLAKNEGQEQYLTTDIASLSEALNEKPEKFGALMAFVDETAIGYLSYTWNYSIWQGLHYMNLDDLFVLASHRGRKVGEQLMDTAKVLCKEKGIYRIRWEVEKENNKAIKFYNRLGAQLKEKGIFNWSFE